MLLNYFSLRMEALKDENNPLRNLNRSRCPEEDLIAWCIRKRYSPWTDEQMVKYQDAMASIALRLDVVLARNGIQNKRSY